MDLIVPTTYHSPWTSVMDVEGIKILMPFQRMGEDVANAYPGLDYILYRDFYDNILLRCHEIAQSDVENQRQMSYKITATRLLNLLAPHFGMDSNLNIVNLDRTFKFDYDENGIPPYNKSLLHNFPIQPVEYNQGDSYEILKTLSSCGKVALLDTDENIKKITPFLNDNPENVVFVSGTGDSFFNEMTAWILFPVRDSYAEQRLKVMRSSGILAHWEFLHKLWKPEKLLDYYANWTHPKKEAVSRLDFNSNFKIVTGFYLCGMCLVIDLFVLIAEIMIDKLSTKFQYYIQKLFTHFKLLTTQFFADIYLE